jgi:hypothetical protein
MTAGKSASGRRSALLGPDHARIGNWIHDPSLNPGSEKPACEFNGLTEPVCRLITLIRSVVWRLFAENAPRTRPS